MNVCHEQFCLIAEEIIGLADQKEAEGTMTGTDTITDNRRVRTRSMTGTRKRTGIMTIRRMTKQTKLGTRILTGTKPGIEIRT